MAHPVARLVEAVRGLRTFRSPSGDPNVVRMACPASEFPQRVAEIHDALEACDTSESFSVLDDVEKLKRGLDAAVMWVSLQGGDLKDFERTVLAAISEKPKKPKGYALLPKFRSKGGRKRWTPETTRRDRRAEAMGRINGLLARSPDEVLAADAVRTVMPADQPFGAVPGRR